MSPFILSICIPTYNRAELLNKALNSIAKQIGDNQKIEVVVLDNASSDNTEAVFKEYSQFTNFKYYRNEANIGGDKNIEKVLTLAQGLYLKYLNDYLEFKEGSIIDMLSIVESNKSDQPILFFPDAYAYSKKDLIATNTLDEFLVLNPIHSTWLAAIGFWKRDLEIMNTNKGEKTNLSLYQTELLLENFQLKQKALTINKKYFNNNEVKNKGGYDFFSIFVDNYFNYLIKGLKTKKLITLNTYLIVKRRFLWDFIMPWYIVLIIKKAPDFRFEMNNTNSIIFNTYKSSIFFYLAVFKVFLVWVKFKINAILYSYRVQKTL